MPIIDWQLLDMTHIEPFTLIIWSEKLLFQLVWDGEKKYRNRLDSDLAHLFSSANLYNNAAKAKREDEFLNWIAMKPPLNKLTLLRFFQSFEDNQNGFIINRNNEMKTVSYTFIELNKTNATMNYYDLDNYGHYSEELYFATPVQITQ